MSNFYISDTHFGCINKFDHRTLETDKLIKENWNSKVTNGDTVYILGDVGREGNNRENEYLLQILSTLKGKKVLVAGNHDKLEDYRIRQIFSEICYYKEVRDSFKGKTYNLVLSHYPILMWNGQHKEYIHLYGHTHNSTEDTLYQNSLGFINDSFEIMTKMGRTDCPQCRAINVGEMKGYMNHSPQTLETIFRESAINE